MELYHNSRKQEYRSPYGAVAVGTTVTISLDVSEAERVYLRLWTGSETLIPMTKGEARTIYCGVDCAGNAGTGVVLFPGGYGRGNGVLWGGSRRHGKMHRSAGILADHGLCTPAAAGMVPECGGVSDFPGSVCPGGGLAPVPGECGPSGRLEGNPAHGDAGVERHAFYCRDEKQR